MLVVSSKPCPDLRRVLFASLPFNFARVYHWRMW